MPRIASRTGSRTEMGGVRMRGFFLLETLLAVSLILVVVPALLSVAASGISSGIYAKQQVIAYSLAQEGIEIARNIRDRNLMLAYSGVSLDWRDDFARIPGPGAGSRNCHPKRCRVQVNAPVFADQLDECTGSCPETDPFYRICVDTVTGFYSHVCGGTSIPTQFYRSFEMNRFPGNDEEIELVSTVVWKTGIFDKRIVLREIVTQWLQ